MTQSEWAVCDRCGRVNSPRARFCGSCGQPLPPAGRPADFHSLMRQADDLAGRGPRLFPEARRAYLAAARMAPTEAAPLLALARLCRQVGRREQARTVFKAAVRRDERLWEAWAEGAASFARHDHFRRALWFARALRTARRAGRQTPGQLQDQFFSSYGRLRSWERWLIRVLTS